MYFRSGRDFYGGEDAVEHIDFQLPGQSLAKVRLFYEASPLSFTRLGGGGRFGGFRALGIGREFWYCGPGYSR